MLYGSWGGRGVWGEHVAVSWVPLLSTWDDHNIVFVFFFNSLKFKKKTFFSFIFISWRLITSQHCSGFCHTLTWIHNIVNWLHPTENSLKRLWKRGNCCPIISIKCSSWEHFSGLSRPLASCQRSVSWVRSRWTWHHGSRDAAWGGDRPGLGHGAPALHGCELHRQQGRPRVCVPLSEGPGTGVCH